MGPGVGAKPPRQRNQIGSRSDQPVSEERRHHRRDEADQSDGEAVEGAGGVALEQGARRAESVIAGGGVTDGVRSREKTNSETRDT
jgi:hypothetical protein